MVPTACGEETATTSSSQVNVPWRPVRSMQVASVLLLSRKQLDCPSPQCRRQLRLGRMYRLRWSVWGARVGAFEDGCQEWARAGLQHALAWFDAGRSLGSATDQHARLQEGTCGFSTNRSLLRRVEVLSVLGRSEAMPFDSGVHSLERTWWHYGPTGESVEARRLQFGEVYLGLLGSRRAPGRLPALEFGPWRLVGRRCLGFMIAPVLERRRMLVRRCEHSACSRHGQAHGPLVAGMYPQKLARCWIG